MNSDELDDDRLDARLRAAFSPPPNETFAAQARAAVAGATIAAHRDARRWPWFFVAAAAAVIAMAFLFLDRPARGPEGHDGHELGRMWAAAYEHALAEGFGGAACCAPDVDLAKICEEKFATRLGLASGSVKLLGCYCGDQPTGGCMALLARAGAEPVAVYVLPCDRDPRPELPADSELHLARREVGPLVLYALSKSAVPGTLDEFVVP